MADEVRLLTAEEIEAIRLTGAAWLGEETFARLMATLEDQEAELERRRLQQQIVHERNTGLTEDRDAWRATAQRFKIERDELRAERDTLRERVKALEKSLMAEEEEHVETLGARDTWKAEAQDQRARVERLQAELELLMAERDRLRRRLSPIAAILGSDWRCPPPE